MRGSRQLQFNPSNGTRTSKNLPETLEVRCPSPDHSPCFFRQIQGNLLTHSCFCLVGCRRLYQITSLKPWQVLLQSLQAHSSIDYPIDFCTSMPHCQSFAHSFLFSSHLANGLASCSSSRICTPPLHAVGLVILCKILHYRQRP